MEGEEENEEKWSILPPPINNEVIIENAPQNNEEGREGVEEKQVPFVEEKKEDISVLAQPQVQVQVQVQAPQPLPIKYKVVVEDASGSMDIFVARTVWLLAFAIVLLKQWKMAGV